MINKLYEDLVENTSEEFVEVLFLTIPIIFLVFAGFLTFIHYVGVSFLYTWMVGVVVAISYHTIATILLISVAVYLSYVYEGEDRPISEDARDTIFRSVIFIGFIISFISFCMTLYTIHWMVLTIPLTILVTMGIMFSIAYFHRKSLYKG